MKLSVILLTYNSQNTIMNCLNSLADNYNVEFKKKEYEVIVFDNNSPDTTLSEVKNFFQENSHIKHQISQSSKNLGYAAGINKAVEYTSGKYILILNPDTTVKNEGLARMLDYIEEDEKVAIMGGRLVSENKIVEKSAGNDFNLLHVLSLSLGVDSLFKMRFAPDTIEDVNWVSGGCMLVRRKIFQDLNGFDERYFMYVEDADLCRRARDVDYKVVYFPEFEVTHEAHASGSREFAIANIYKGLRHYSRKFHGQLEQFLIQFLLVAKAGLLIAISKIVRDNKLHDTYSKALKEI